MTKLHFWLLFVFPVSFAISRFVFTKTDVKVIRSLAQHFQMGYCIVEKESSDLVLAAIFRETYPARHEMLTASLDFFEIYDLINREPRYDAKTMVVMKMSNESIRALQKLSVGENVTSMFTWILFSDRSYDPDFFQNIYIPFDCEFIFVHRKKFEQAYLMTELYQVAKTTKMETYEVGNWTKTRGLALVDLPFYERRNSLKGHKFVALVNNNPPYVSIGKNEEGNTVISGYFFEIWRELETRLEFRTDFPASLFEKSPTRVLRRKEADFALGRIPNFHRNAMSMDFIQPLIEARFYAFGHRRNGELDWDSYLKPFSANIWYANLIWMLSSSLALTIFYRLAWYLRTSEREAEYFVFTYSESVLTVFRAICMQGSDVTPNSYSCRLIFLSIYVTALVVTSAFSAALFAILTVPKPKSHFNSLSELFSNRSYEIAFPSDPAFQRALESYTDFLWTSSSTLKERIMESNFKLHLSASQGLQKICDNKFLIFIYDMPNVLHLMQNMTKSCQNSIIPLDQPLFTEYIGLAFSKNSPYKKIMNHHLTRLKNEGILNRIYLHSWPPRIPKIRPQWTEATFSDVSPVFCLFIVGSFFGVFVFSLERFVRYVKRKKTERPSDQVPPVQNLFFYH